MEVELDIYSGQPNPVWALSSEEAEEFRRRLSALPSGSPHSDLPGLGYRGLVATDDSQRIDHCDRVEVWDGAVRCQQGGMEKNLLDSGRTLERWLLETGKQHLAPDLYAYVSNELSA